MRNGGLNTVIVAMNATTKTDHSKAYQSSNNVPFFDTPPVESEISSVSLDDDEALWKKWSWGIKKWYFFVIIKTCVE